ncbi:MAG: fibronectin type III-like domain-contianing protein, partial [Clostridia bacterium]|nr:fibronectin type III-like domain-contianing protein [Clostridia bacterium]
KSVEITKGETVRVTMDIDRYWLKAVDNDGERVEPDGKIKLYVGGHQPDSVSNKLMGYECIELEIK